MKHEPSQSPTTAHSRRAPSAGSAAGPTPEEYAEASLQTAINALRAGRYVDSYIECASAMASIVKAKELRSPKPPNNQALRSAPEADVERKETHE